MSESLYDQGTYQRFYESLLPLLDLPNIKHLSMRKLRKLALQTGTRTKFGSYGWRSSVSSRIGPKTVYLGNPSVQLPNPSDLQKRIIREAPEELHKVLKLMRSLPFVHIRRQMGNNKEFNPICNLYVSIADPKNYRIAYMWANTMRQSDRKPGPEFVMIHIPEEHQLNQQVLVLPEFNLNIALGTDYMGEDKKGFLRQAMWQADEHDMLGLHAGTKLVYVRNAKDDKLKKYGVFLFGLSATGKSTWSCHQLGLDFNRGERTEVIQDDIVFLRRNGSALGSETGFFVKTDVEKDLQEAMYYALIDKSALFENVMIAADGTPDFLDESLCANGRAVIQKNKLRIKKGRRLVNISAKTLDLPPLDELDGIMFAFITRRNTIMPFSQKLTPEQAVLAYLWGESTHSYASQPEKAGESVRIVGTDPFIIGSHAKKVNRFYNIIMDLMERYPGKVQFYQYNTGGIGEIIETVSEGSLIQKRVVRKATRVPIQLMAAIQRGDLRGSNRYEKGRFDTEEIVYCESGNPREPNPDQLYSEDQIAHYLQEIVDGRRDFTEELANEGLLPEIINIAEKSFTIAPKPIQVSMTVPDKLQPERDLPRKSLDWLTKSRPKRASLGRLR